MLGYTINPLSVLPAFKQLVFLLAPEIIIKLIYKGYSITTTLRTVLGDVLDHLHCVAISRLLHLSGGLPGFLCLVEVEDVVEP